MNDKLIFDMNLFFKNIQQLWIYSFTKQNRSLEFFNFYVIRIILSLNYYYKNINIKLIIKLLCHFYNISNIIPMKYLK